MKNQQQLSPEKINTNYCSPLNHLKDAQEFSEKLFSRVQSSSNERLEVKMMMIKVIAQTVGLHHLILLDLYPYLQKYVQRHERDGTTLLAAVVQACHKMVPPDAVESLFKQIVNQFVFDRSQPEAITVGLNVVREICLRMPLLMTEELLQDLVLYTKSHEKAVSVSARSLFTLFRELCPSLLVKKDRGRPAELKAKPKAFGEVHVPCNIPGVELLEEEDQGSTDEDIDGKDSQEDDSVDLEEDERGESDGGGSIGSDRELYDGSHEDDEISDDEDDVNYSVYGGSEIGDVEGSEENDGADEYDDSIRKDADVDSNKSKEKKRKLSEFEGQLNAGNISLGALKKLLGTARNKNVKPIRHVKAKSNSMGSAIGEFSRWNYKVLRLTKKENLAFKSRGLDPDNMTTCAIKTIGPKILGEKRERITAKIARTRHQQKIKQKCSGKQSRLRKA